VGELSINLRAVGRQPLDAIWSVAGKEAVDLIVLGTHGYTGLKHALLGSLAEDVVRHSTVPVFVVKQKEHQSIDATLTENVPKFERILCPYNHTKIADFALRHASVPVLMIPSFPRE